MSGEIVVASTLGPSLAVTGALIGAVVVGSLIYQHIQNEIAERRRLAEFAREQLAAELKRLEASQRQQEAVMHSAASAWKSAKERLAGLAPLDTSPEHSPALGNTAKGQGFLGHSQALAAQAKRLDALLAIAQGLPDDPSLPGARALAGLRQSLELLKAQQSQQQASILDLDTLEQTLRQTLADQETQLQQEPERRAWRLQEAMRLLGRLDELGAILGEPTDHRLQKMRAEIHQLLGQGSASNQAISDLNDRIESLAKAITTEAQNQLIDRQLKERLAHHLTSLGYRHLRSEDQADRWAIPGGEQILASVQPGMRLAFQLQHERFPGRDSTAALDHSEIALLRQQESRWCGDLKTLLRHLQSDGFMLQVDFERLIPEEAVPLVVIEDVEEILAQTKPKALRQG